MSKKSYKAALNIRRRKGIRLQEKDDTGKGGNAYSQYGNNT